MKRIAWFLDMLADAAFFGVILLVFLTILYVAGSFAVLWVLNHP